MHRIEILDQNTAADGPFFNEWLKSNFNNYIGYSFSDKIFVYFSSEITNPERVLIEEKYNSLTGDDILSIEGIVYTYSLRKVDGENYYNDLRAKLSISFNSGDLTIQNAFYIEDKLMKVKSFLMSGDWATAQYEVSNNITIAGAVSNDDISNNYTQALHDEIKLKIDTYVQDNY